MFPGMGNPKQMAKMLKNLGIESSEIEAKKVVIETEKGKIIVEEPQVIEIRMQGQKTFQVMGTVREEESEGKGYSEEDIELVMEQAKSTREEAEEALKAEEGEIAKAIKRLQEGK